MSSDYRDSLIYFVSGGSNGFFLFGRFRSYSRTLDFARISFDRNHNLTLGLLMLRRLFVQDFWEVSEVRFVLRTNIFPRFCVTLFIFPILFRLPDNVH
jgi:hypothetical protein